MTASATIVPLPSTAVAAPQAFDYSVVSTEIADGLRQQADRIRRRIGKSTQDLIDVGRDLLAAKRHLIERGQFIAWVESEVGILARTAQNYMRAADLAESHQSETISLFPPKIVYLLAAKSTPRAIVEDVLTRAGAGDILPEKAVRELVEEAVHQKQQAEAEARRDAKRRKQSRRQRKAREAQEREWQEEKRRREQRTVETAARLRDALGSEGVALVVEAFSDRDIWADDLLFALKNITDTKEAA